MGIENDVINIECVFIRAKCVVCACMCVFHLFVLYCAVLMLFQEIYSIHSFIHSFIHCFQHYSRPFCSHLSKYLSQFNKLNFFLRRSTASHSTVLQCRRVVRYHLHNEEPCKIRHQWQHLTHKVLTTCIVTRML